MLASSRAARCAGLGALIAACCAGTARAQANNQNRTVTVNYVYAAQIGIGSYDLSGLSVRIFTLPLSDTFDVGPNGGWRLKVKLPINLGLYDFNAVDVDGTRISVHQQTLALIPGVELQIPVTDQWTLKPLADFGAGRLLQSPGTAAYIYSAGVKSALTLIRGTWNLTLGNAVIYAGDQAFGNGGGERYLVTETGIELRRSLGIDIGGFRPDLALYGIGYFYPNELEFTRFLQEPLRIRNQIEFGVTLGSAEPFQLWTFQNPRIGIGYVFGGGLSVLRVSFGFPF